MFVSHFRAFKVHRVLLDRKEVKVTVGHRVFKEPKVCWVIRAFKEFKEGKARKAFKGFKGPKENRVYREWLDNGGHRDFKASR